MPVFMPPPPRGDLIDMGKPSMGTPADMRLKANMMPDTTGSTGKAPAFGTPEWRAKYGKTAKKKPATAATAATATGTGTGPAFGTPAWRAKYAKHGK